MSLFRDFAKIAAAVAEEALTTGLDALETKREQVGRKLDQKATQAATVINKKREQLEDVVAGVVTTVDLLLTDLEQQFNPRAQQKVEPTTTLDKPAFQAPKEEAAAAPAAKEEKAAAPKAPKAAKKPAAPKATAKKPAAAKKKPAAPKAPK